MTTADILRETTADMRAKAEAATPGPWWDRSTEYGRTAPHYGDFGWYVPGCPAGETEDTPQGRADAALIAHASPTFVLAVAEWLEHMAELDGFLSTKHPEAPPSYLETVALAVARAWRGE